MHQHIDIDHIVGLYRTYAHDLDRVREQQRGLLAPTTSLKAQLDDIEAEITYLLLREARLETVVEIGTFHGWSTTWILQALKDNGTGHLYSYDIVDHVARNVPEQLSTGRWTFTQGDARENLEKIPDTADFLFIDAAHSASFARWYIQHLLPRMRPGIPVCVHDVFHGRRPLPFTPERHQTDPRSGPPRPGQQGQPHDLLHAALTEPAACGEAAGFPSRLSPVRPVAVRPGRRRSPSSATWRPDGAR
ncbi:class I SAM-dependent methyltransferase [Streptomyces sp. NPDC001617]